MDPIPMLLWCPQCSKRHVDAGEFATKSHHTHACQHCGMVWRPAIQSTVGVEFLPGFKDSETPSLSVEQQLRVTTYAVLRAWESLHWRHHGTGLLQAYINMQMRVHVWHRDLLLPGMEDSGAKHNHRFHLRSMVLLGSLTHSRLTLTDDLIGDHQVVEIVGASNRDATMVPRQRVRVAESVVERFTTGDQYEVPIWDFHWARQEPDDAPITVTLVSMTDKVDAPASLVCPVGTMPVHAFSHKVDLELMRPLLDKAECLLRKECES